MTILITMLLLMASCGKVQPISQPLPQERIKRYSITQKDPLVLSDNITVLLGQSDRMPSLWLLTQKGEILQDDNLGLSHNAYDEEDRRLGLGPSYVFNKIDATIQKNKEWFDKASIRFLYKNDQVKREYNYLIDERFSNTVFLDSVNDIIDCELTGTGHLHCFIYGDNPKSGTVKKSIWGDTQNPLVEISAHSNPVYALSKDGQLWFFPYQFGKDAKKVNSGIRFLKNSQDRYFLNAANNQVCLQSDTLAIYCLEYDKLGNDFQSDPPPISHLKKVIDLDFKVEEVAYSGRHSCFLSMTGEVFCVGDNSCGQITGRYNPSNNFEPLQKIDFLKGPARQLFVYAGGTCALLKDGQLQCFGLGASVKRTKILPLEKYSKSFSYFHGFRPNQICGSGAEYGI